MKSDVPGVVASTQPPAMLSLHFIHDVEVNGNFLSL
jgi:hypothetical protein